MDAIKKLKSLVWQRFQLFLFSHEDAPYLSSGSNIFGFCVGIVNVFSIDAADFTAQIAGAAIPGDIEHVHTFLQGNGHFVVDFFRYGRGIQRHRHFFFAAVRITADLGVASFFGEVIVQGHFRIPAAPTSGKSCGRALISVSNAAAADIWSCCPV